MGIRAEEQEYFENQSQTRVLYIPNLSIFLVELHKQTLRVPHEVTMMNANQPMGATEQDIINSISRGVDIVYVMLAPLRALLSKKKGETVNYTEPDDIKKQNQFNRAMNKLEWCYLLMEEADILNERTIDIDLPADEDEYDYGGEADDGTPTALPAHKPSADDPEVGPVEVKVQEHMDA